MDTLYIQCSLMSRAPRYGNHLSKEEVDEFITPGSKVAEYLSKLGWFTAIPRFLSRTRPPVTG